MVILATLGTGLVLVVPGASRAMVDAVVARRSDSLGRLAIIAVSAVAARQLLFTARTIVNNRFELTLAHERRVEVYEKLQRLPVGWFDSRSTGDVLSRVSSDVPAMQRLILEGIDQALMAVLQIVLVIGYLVSIQPRMAGLMLVPIPVIVALVAWYTRAADPRATEASVAAGGVGSVLGDSIGGVRQIKLFAVENDRADHFRAASMRLQAASMSMIRLNAVVWPGATLMTEVWMIVTILVSLHWVLAGTMTLGTLTAALLLWGVLYEPVGRLPPILGTAASATASARRVFEILDRPDEADLDDGLSADAIDGRLCFDDVRFAHQPDRPVLCGFDLRADPGQTIALVGPTGGGKTTVLNLLTRFYEPDAGRIELDDVPLDQYAKRSLRQQIGYVTQESFLFDTTIAENLRLACPDADDDALWSALRLAEAESFVRESPGGLNASVGERGSRLSGGQRQRLSIARVLLKNPRILLLDEATSALDNQTEAAIQRALANLRAGRTTLVIAHRLSTVVDADRIAMLDGGVVTETGTHDELVQSGGTYAKWIREL